MPSEVITHEKFVRGFSDSLRYDYDFENPLYTLILGAGASRSAGIPLVCDMVRALGKLARVRGLRLGAPPRHARGVRRESKLSWYFRRIFGSLEHERKESADEQHVSTGRDFLMSCILRAQREANVTHLVAAHLGSAGIINPIVTTNFDDLSLAAFWNLPWTGPGDEPHVIYDAPSVAKAHPRIARRVPIILKAHGHHTTYGMGILDRQIATLAPFVRDVMATLPKPSHGFIVAGYSGGWDDGVMRVLRDRSITRGKLIYWLFQGDKPPDNEHVRRVSSCSEVRFVPIVDSDLSFACLWGAIPGDDYFSVGRHLIPQHLFSFPPGWMRSHTTPKIGVYDWFNPTLVRHGDGEWKLEDPEKFSTIKKQLLPILDRIEQWDDRHLIEDCISGPSSALQEFKGIQKLQKLVPVDIPWTRRNRKILRLGLGSGVDLQLGTLLLSGLCALGHFWKKP